MAGFRIEGNTSGNVAEVNSSNELKTTLTQTPANAGLSRINYLANSSNSKEAQVAEDGQLLSGNVIRLLDIDWNSSGSTFNSVIGTNATSQTKSVTNGFMRLNSGAVTTTTTGISIYTTQVLTMLPGRELRVRMAIKHTNATATNKQMEWGIGYYNFAAGQANPMNEFVGFRITAGGVLQGVVAYTTGGAPTETTVNVNGGTPFTDGQAKVYEIRVSQRKAEFWADGTLWNTISIAADVYNLLKAAAYPFIARVFNSGAASAAPLLDVGPVSAYRIGSDDDIPYPYVMASMNRGTHYYQADTGITSDPANFPASGTGPTAATGSNTASAINNPNKTYGLFALNAASITVAAAANVNVLISGFQNPAIPQANGASVNGRNLVITSMTVSPMVVTTAVGGQTGNWVAQWFMAVGSSALSLATADADGTTAVAARAPRWIPHPHILSFAANAAAGTVETPAGDYTLQFLTPIVVHPGEFVSTGIRTLFAPTVVATSGVLQGSVYLNGYWE